MKYSPNLFVVSVVVAAVFCLTGCSGGEKKPPVQPAQPTKGDVVPPALPKPDVSEATESAESEPPEIQADFEMTGRDLIKELKENPDQTKAKYEGKWIKLSGEVDSLHISLIFDGCDVQVDRDLFDTLICEFEGLEAEAGKVTRLVPTQKVVILGKADDRGALESCKIVEIGEDPAVHVDAISLTKEHLEDKDAAETNYKGKPARITGRVLKFVEDGDDALCVFLEGFKSDEGAQTVVVVFASSAYDYAKEKFKVGDTVVAQGILDAKLGHPYFDKNRLYLRSATVVGTAGE